MIRLRANQLIVLTAVYLTLLANLSFFGQLMTTFGDQPNAAVKAGSAALVLTAITIVLLALVSFGRFLKPWLVLLLLVAAGSAYFMDRFHVIIDPDMLRNVQATDPHEVGELITLRLVMYLLVITGIPTLLLSRVELAYQPGWREAKARVRLVSTSVLVAGLVVTLSGSFFATLIREHKPIRYFTNPLTPVYSLFSLAREADGALPGEVTPIGTDATTPVEDDEHELVVMVVGETARADRFSLNGYGRDTNPELAREKVFSFSHVESCGTSTAVSVPCMFFLGGHGEFSSTVARSTQNALDVLQHAGVKVLWRDNNSTSKGVAERVPQQDFRSPELNPDCDIECRDTGMLAGLEALVEEHPDEDILIVLHQMGSHGPAYDRRYPMPFRHFTPACEDPGLSDCSAKEISNAYDNSIRYTDHFLAAVIHFLESYDSDYETAMFYVGDHGESLGENGLYLHGMPAWMAPETQTHVPLLFWFGQQNPDIDRSGMESITSLSISHDYVAHTLLGLFEIESDVYRPRLDLMALSRDGVDAARPAAGI